jgi:hypothetical protein
VSDDSESDKDGESPVDSAVLEEDFDPHYESSSAEIQEYAEFLGMDSVFEPESVTYKCSSSLPRGKRQAEMLRGMLRMLEQSIPL